MNHEDHNRHEEHEYKKLFVVFASVVAFVVMTLAALAAQLPSFRGRVDTVMVTVTVTDATGRIVTGLTKADFELFEDGTAQPITQFTRRAGAGQPGCAARRQRQHARPGDGRCAYGGRSLRRRTARAGRRSVRRGLQSPAAHDGAVDAAAGRSWRGSSCRSSRQGATAIYDALVATAPLFERRQHTRAALVVISDGADTASDRTLQQARAVLRRTDPFVYAIAIDESGGQGEQRVNPDALREITAPSGGYTEVVASADDLGPATERIANELNERYTLGYVPTRVADGGWREIRIRMKDARLFHARAPRLLRDARWPAVKGRPSSVGRAFTARRRRNCVFRPRRSTQKLPRPGADAAPLHRSFLTRRLHGERRARCRIAAGPRHARGRCLRSAVRECLAGAALGARPAARLRVGRLAPATAGAGPGGDDGGVLLRRRPARRPGARRRPAYAAARAAARVVRRISHRPDRGRPLDSARGRRPRPCARPRHAARRRGTRRGRDDAEGTRHRDRAGLGAGATPAAT